MTAATNFPPVGLDTWTDAWPKKRGGGGGKGGGGGFF